MFRYELVNSTRKFTIVAEIVSLLKKIYKRNAPFRTVFKVKTLPVLFSPYPRDVKHIPRNLNLPPFWRLIVSIEMVQSIPTRALSRARLSMRTYLTAVDLWTFLGMHTVFVSDSQPIWFVGFDRNSSCVGPTQRWLFLVRTKTIRASGQHNG